MAAVDQEVYTQSENMTKDTDNNMGDVNENDMVHIFPVILIIMAICCNSLLLCGITYKISILFIPWMIFYGLELFVSWISGFFLIFGDMPSPGLVLIARGAILTWIWVFGVRRAFKEMGELASRPKLQTMYSIAVANPFSPRPDGIYGDLPLSKIPPLPLDYD